MKSTRPLLASSLLSLALAAATLPARADGAIASAILGGSPYAIDNYGANVVKGRAELLADGRSSNTQVVARLTGLKPGSAHIGHIHAGTCARLIPGTILHNLEPIVADQQGAGTSRTEIPESIRGLVDCEWWVAFHEGAENTDPQTPAIAVGPVIVKVDRDDRRK